MRHEITVYDVMRQLTVSGKGLLSIELHHA